MRVEAFRAWLEEGGASAPKAQETRVRALERIENNLGALGSSTSDLEAEWSHDQFGFLREKLHELQKDAKSGGEGFRLLLPKSEKPERRLSNWRRWLNQYGRFLSGETHGTKDADLIRRYVLENYIEPARERDDNETEILVKDVNDALDLKEAWPNICQSLTGPMFQELAGVPPPQRFGANMSTATRFRFDLYPEDYWAEAILRERYGEPVNRTLKIVAFALPDQREVALDLESSKALLWFEGALPEDLIAQAEITEYGATEGRNSNLTARLRHKGALARPVSSVTVPNGATMRELLDYYDENSPAFGSKMTNEEILRHFDGDAHFRRARQSWTSEQTDAFCRIALAAHEAGFDWWHVAIPSTPVRFGRKSAGRKQAEGVQGYLSVEKPKLSFNDPSVCVDLGLPNFPVDLDHAPAFASALAAHAGAIASWKAPVPARPGLWPDQAGTEENVDEFEGSSKPEPVNLILYGPPGTGKTYRTAYEAVRLCGDQTTFSEDSAGRKALMDRYAELVKARQIEFVTFHQSFSYEEFVEGLRPETTTGDDQAASGGFRLEPRDGIFREIALRAEEARTTGQSGVPFDLTGRRVFKMSLGRAGVEDYIFDEAIDGGYAGLGYGGQIDWSPYDSYKAIHDRWNQDHPDTNGNDANIAQMSRFRVDMKKGDIIVVSHGNHKIRAIGEVAGPYEYDPTGEYFHRRKVDWLKVFKDPLPSDIIYDVQLIQSSCYLLNEKHLNRRALANLLPGKGAGDASPKQFVLIIDEINRANISKVFGELITLIEPDKRLGMDNALKVRLPYSKREFGVPSNLHILGTMNTADRSITLLDTALRRRFRFEELAPDPTKLGQSIEGVPLRAVLETINKRIEYLLDRDHVVGHAFFMGDGGKDRAAIDRTMRFKVIPLLQEYFFEDWSRIHAVLGSGFIEGKPLSPPPGIEGTRERKSWSVRPSFPGNAFDILLAGVPVEPTAEDEDEPAQMAK